MNIVAEPVIEGRSAHGGGYCRAPVVEIDNKVYHGHIISNKAMKVRVPHCELKWEMSDKRRARK